MVDLHLLHPPLRMLDRDHPLTHVFSKLRSLEVQSEPVVSLSSDARYLAAARSIAARDRRGVCLRLGIEQAAGQSLQGRVDSVLADVGVAPAACDLVLDLGAPSFDPLEDFADLVCTLVSELPHLRRWRSFALLGTSFPPTLAGLPVGLTLLPRQEWRLYRRLLSLPSLRKARVPDFGDYGINHPAVLKEDMRILKPSAAIRYTVDDGWLIARGTNLRVAGAFRQFYRLSADIVGSRHYCGPDYSVGDQRIKQCASGKGGPGSLTTWRFIGTNHHLEKVARDLATQLGP